jgi:MSHA pilin protein MshD
MRTKKSITMPERGFTLIELIAFIVVIGLSLTTIGSVFQHSVIRIQDPLINSHLLSMAQSQLDEVLSRKFDENTPTGGVPVCGSGDPCAGIGLDIGEDLSAIATLDDVDDFHLYQDIPAVGYTREVSVVNAGIDFGVDNEQAKRITVTVTSPQGIAMSLASYRFNF